MTTQTDQILNLIRAKGQEGAANWELSNIALQYNFHIHKLRKDGYNIRKRRAPDLRDGTSSQTFYYYLGAPTDNLAPEKLDKIEPVKVDDVDVSETDRTIHMVFKGRAVVSGEYERGHAYHLEIGKLEVGQPIKILSPYPRSYADLAHLNRDWAKIN